MCQIVASLDLKTALRSTYGWNKLKMQLSQGKFFKCQYIQARKGGIRNLSTEKLSNKCPRI